MVERYDQKLARYGLPTNIGERFEVEFKRSGRVIRAIFSVAAFRFNRDGSMHIVIFARMDDEKLSFGELATSRPSRIYARGNADDGKYFSRKVTVRLNPETGLQGRSTSEEMSNA